MEHIRGNVLFDLLLGALGNEYGTHVFFDDYIAILWAHLLFFYRRSFGRFTDNVYRRTAASKVTEKAGK